MSSLLRDRRAVEFASWIFPHCFDTLPCAGFNWPVLLVAAPEPFGGAPEAVKDAWISKSFP